MKKFLLYFATGMLFLSLIITTGCTEDEPGGGGVDIAPLVIITSSPAATVQDQDAIVTFTVEVTKGTQVLNTLTITEDGVNVDASRLTFTGIGTANNPQLITGSDIDGLTWDVTLNVHDAFDTRTYEVIASDKGGLTDSETFNITVEDPIVTTPLDTTITGVLFNQAGDAGRGSLDLDEGLSAGVTTTGQTTPAEAEIRDMGLDCTIPAPGFNWRRQIGAFNGTEVRMVDLTQVENFTFDGVNDVESIQNAFDTGFTYSEDDATNCSSGTSVTVQHVSPELAVGDLIVVLKGSKYYLIRVDDLTETGMDNDDFYTFSIKYGSL